MMRVGFVNADCDTFVNYDTKLLQKQRIYDMVFKR